MKKIIFGALASLMALNANAALINIYESGSSITSIEDSLAVIDSAGTPDTSFEGNLFFSDAGHHGASTLPGGHNTTFVLTASGEIDTSLYSGLKFFHDDGLDVNLAGNSLYTFDGNTGLKDSGWNMFADTGVELFDLMYWENTGSGSLLVYGMLRDGGASEVAKVSVPAPTTMAFFALGLMGLAAARRKA